MKFARFEYKGDVSFGIVKEDVVAVLDGSLFDTYKETDTHYKFSDVKLLHP